MKNIIKKSIQNSSLSNQVSLSLIQTTLLLCLMLVSFTSLQAQVLPIDFSLSEDAFYGDGGASFEITTNNPDIINGGDGQIGKITTSGAAWENVQLDLSTYLDLTTSNKTITFDFYSTTVVPVLLKLEGGLNGGAPIEVSVTSTNTGWQTMTYVFATADEQYTKLVIFPDAAGTSAGTYYIDDIAGGANGENTSPSSVPTAPTNDSIDVISLFSDEYTPVDGVNIDPNWGQATDSQIVTIGGEEVLRYINLNYQGLVWDEMDVSTMEYLHFDYWTQNPNMDLNFSLIKSGGVEVLFDVDAGGTLTTGQWVSLDIPMSYFINGNLDLSNVDQIKTTNGPGNIFLDNIYFWRDPVVAGTDATLSDLQVDSATLTGFSSGTTSYIYEVAFGASTPQITAATTTDANASTSIIQATTIPGDATVVVTAQDGTTTQTYTVYYYYPSPTTGASAPPSRYAGDVISIFGDTYTNVPIANYDPSWGQSGNGLVNPSYDPGDGNILLAYPKFSYQGTDLTGTQDASSMEYLHVDLWTPTNPNVSVIKVTPINNGTGVGEVLVPITYTPGTWSSVDIPIGDFTGMTWDSIWQFKFDGGNGIDTIYLDNIYFWKSSTCASTTIWDGTAWSNGVPDANAYAIINGAYSTGTDGDLATCVLQVDANLTLDSTTGVTAGDVLVTAGNTLTIDETSSLTVSGDFTNTGTVSLNSTADDYSSLIVTGTATGDITYNRFVNSYNDGLGGGWDLVGSPTVMTIKDFITANGANIEVLGSDYAFSQYDNAIGDWIRYETGSQTGSFTTGQGYSMATVEVSPPPPGAAGATVAFTGAMQTTSQSINVINNNGLNGVGRRWNLVSNPFPSYINGNTAAGATNFIDTNLAVIDGNYGAVYGWNGSSYTIYNLLDGAFSIAPGQGFWIAAASESEVALNFTAAMRTTTGSGDFVTGPQPLTYYVGLKLYNGEIEKATTDFYFRGGLSLGLDSGYDAGAFNQSTKLSTRLPQGSNQTAFARNAMGMDAMQNTRVPLEIRQNAGQAFTISIEDMELPEDIYVYLEDTANGTLTSLKDADFELTAQSDLSGVDRFFIVFKSNSVLSNGDAFGIDALNVYKANTDSFVTIAGITPDLGHLDVRLYSMLGVAVKQAQLNTTTATQTISTDGLASGLYMVQIKSGNQTIVKKIIVK